MRGESKNEGVFFDLYKKEITPRTAPEWDQVAMSARPQHQ